MALVAEAFDTSDPGVANAGMGLVIDAKIAHAKILDLKIVDGEIVDGRIVGGQVVKNELAEAGTARTERARRFASDSLQKEVIAFGWLGLAILLLLLWR
jgi:hypothetical protein